MWEQNANSKGVQRPEIVPSVILPIGKLTGYSQEARNKDLKNIERTT